MTCRTCYMACALVHNKMFWVKVILCSVVNASHVYYCTAMVQNRILRKCFLLLVNLTYSSYSSGFWLVSATLLCQFRSYLLIRYRIKICNKCFLCPRKLCGGHKDLPFSIRWSFILHLMCYCAWNQDSRVMALELVKKFHFSDKVTVGEPMSYGV